VVLAPGTYTIIVICFTDVRCLLLMFHVLYSTGKIRFLRIQPREQQFVTKKKHKENSRPLNNMTITNTNNSSPSTPVGVDPSVKTDGNDDSAPSTTATNTNTITETRNTSRVHHDDPTRYLRKKNPAQVPCTILVLIVVLAMAGIGIWLMASDKRFLAGLILLILSIMCVLSSCKCLQSSSYRSYYGDAGAGVHVASFTGGGGGGCDGK
jgi:hypothetical protein